MFFDNRSTRPRPRHSRVRAQTSLLRDPKATPRRRLNNFDSVVTPEVQGMPILYPRFQLQFLYIRVMLFNQVIQCSSGHQRDLREITSWTETCPKGEISDLVTYQK